MGSFAGLTSSFIIKRIVKNLMNKNQIPMNLQRSLNVQQMKQELINIQYIKDINTSIFNRKFKKNSYNKQR